MKEMTMWRTEEVTWGGWTGAKSNSFQELTYVPKSKPRATSILKGDKSTFEYQKYDSNKIMKPAEEEWDQSDLRLSNYTQNSD
jgi:hypothetical protein